MTLNARWPLDEQQGTSIEDVIGSNTGTWAGTGGQAITSVKSPDDRGIVFDGSADVIDVPADPSIDAFGKDAITIIALIYPKSDGGGDVGRIVSKSFGVTGYECTTFGQGVNTVGLSFRVKKATDMFAATEPIADINKWHHVAFVYDNTDGVRKGKIYLNGTLLTNDETDQAASEGALPDDSATPLNIGNNEATTRGFDGPLSYISIYDTAFTTAEVLDDYNASIANNIMYDNKNQAYEKDMIERDVNENLDDDLNVAYGSSWNEAYLDNTE